MKPKSKFLHIDDKEFLQGFIKNIIIARETKNFTQIESSKILNINIKIITHLENGDLNKLENNVFTLGHIKTYLKWLNIEYELFLRKLKLEEINLNKEEYKKFNLLSKIITNLINKYGKKNIITLIILLSLIFSIIIISLWSIISNKNIQYIDQNNNDTSTNFNKIELIGEKNLEIKNVSKNEINKNTLNNIEIVEKNENIEDEITKDITNLKIIAIEDSWIEIQDKHNEIIISKILKKNENIDISYEKELKLLTGNAGGINIEINNIIIKNLGKDGEIKRNISLNYIDLLKFNE